MGRNISSAVYPEISPGAFPLQVCQIILFHKDSFCSNKWILSDSTTPTRLCLAGLRTLMWCALQTPSNGEGTAVTFAAHEKQSPQTQRTEKCFSESMPQKNHEASILGRSKGMYWLLGMKWTGTWDTAHRVVCLPCYSKSSISSASSYLC